MKKYHPYHWIDDFIHDENISDESVHAVHQFLTTLLYEFESKGFYKLRQAQQREIQLPIKNTDPPF